jgi:hypothetical protein
MQSAFKKAKQHFEKQEKKEKVSLRFYGQLEPWFRTIPHNAQPLRDRSVYENCDMDYQRL